MSCDRIARSLVTPAVRRISTFVFSILLCAASAAAQVPLSADDSKQIIPVLNSSSHNSLHCFLDRWRPNLDFAFRFVSGYLVYCRLAQFEGKESTLISYIQITPEGKSAFLLGSIYRVPELPSEMKQTISGNFKRMKTEISMSGAFALGEGNYRIEFLLKDDRNRTYRKRWRLRVATSRSQHGVALAIQPLTVESVDRTSLQAISPQRGATLRLTILLDAAPINPFQPRLRAWDRAFLLECIYSLLRQTPHRSVHVIAFNLDQQREIFRSDQFDGAAFQGLSDALKDVELSSVSVEVLKKRGSPDFLDKLANEELAADRSDAIIFLGPNTRIDTKVSAADLIEKKPTSPPFFYFEYFPWRGEDFPDSIEHLVRAAHGKVFRIHSPAELDESIDKVLFQLKQE